MPPATLYTICVLAAVGLYLIMRSGGRSGVRPRAFRIGGALLGLGALAFLTGGVIAASSEGPIAGGRPHMLAIVFAVIAIAAAVRMITHHRPVYSALYFVLVVLASAGLFLMLAAEFIAFALIIVYAGAVLITYMFVLMLAQQAPNPDDLEAIPEYDAHPREPLAGVVVGFLLMSLLGRMIVDGVTSVPPPPPLETVRVEAFRDLALLPGRLATIVGAADPEFEEIERAGDGTVILRTAADGMSAEVLYRGAGEERTMQLGVEDLPENIERVGLGLIVRFPVSLEVAGVILLMAMFGAVILARRQIELTEDEKRVAAGLDPLGHHGDVAGPRGGTP